MPSDPIEISSDSSIDDDDTPIRPMNGRRRRIQDDDDDHDAVPILKNAASEAEKIEANGEHRPQNAFECHPTSTAYRSSASDETTSTARPTSGDASQQESLANKRDRSPEKVSIPSVATTY
jgi:hypothetical protein